MAGVQIDGVNNKIDFDDDLDTSISANTDDTLVIEAGGNTMATITATTFTINDGTTITTADNTDTLTLISTDADATQGPVLNLYRNSSAVEDDNDIARINFTGNDSGGNATTYASTRVIINDVTDGTEDTQIIHSQMIGGAFVSTLRCKPDEIVINDSSIDLDFRVESNGNANMFLVDGGTDTVAIGGAADTNATLLIHTTITDDNAGLTIKGAGSATGARLAIADAGSNLGTRAETLEIGYDNSTDFIFSRTGQDLIIGVNSSEVARFTASGLAIGGTGAANTLDDYEEGSYTPAMTVNSGSLTVHGSHNTLAYTKIGRVVHVQGEIRFSAISSPSGAFSMSIPFAVADLAEGSARFMSSPLGQSGFDGTPDGTLFAKNTNEGTTTIAIQTSISGSGSDANVNANQVSTSTEFIFSFTFIAA